MGNLLIAVPLIILFVFHYIFDYICQSDEMANNKHSSFKWLFVHSLAYGIPFLISVLFLNGIFGGTLFPIISIYYLGGINWLSHLTIDFFTSKATAKAYKAKKNKKMDTFNRL